MINIGNIKRKDALLQIFFRKTFSYLASLLFFHDYYYIRPGNILPRNFLFGIKTCRFRITCVFKQFRSGFTSIFILVADKEEIHEIYNPQKIINFTLEKAGSRYLESLQNILQNHYKIASRMTTIIFVSMINKEYTP